MKRASLLSLSTSLSDRPVGVRESSPWQLRGKIGIIGTTTYSAGTSPSWALALSETLPTL